MSRGGERRWSDEGGEDSSLPDLWRFEFVGAGAGGGGGGGGRGRRPQQSPGCTVPLARLLKPGQPDGTDANSSRWQPPDPLTQEQIVVVRRVARQPPNRKPKLLREDEWCGLLGVRSS